MKKTFRILLLLWIIILFGLAILGHFGLVSLGTPYIVAPEFALLALMDTFDFFFKVRWKKNVLRVFQVFLLLLAVAGSICMFITVRKTTEIGLSAASMIAMMATYLFKIASAREKKKSTKTRGEG